MASGLGGAADENERKQWKQQCRSNPRLLNQVLEELAWPVEDVAEVLADDSVVKRVVGLLRFFKPRGGEGSPPVRTIQMGTVPVRGTSETVTLNGASSPASVHAHRPMRTALQSPLLVVVCGRCQRCSHAARVAACAHTLQMPRSSSCLTVRSC